MADQISYIKENLKSIRAATTMGQVDFADLLNLPRSTYVHYEAGNSEPSLQVVMRLIEVTGFSLETLVNSDLSDIPKPELAQKILPFVSKAATKNTTKNTPY